MAANEAIPFFTGSDHITGEVVTAPVVGKTFVKYVAGGRGGQPFISTAGAGEHPAGIAGRDAKVGEAVHLITEGHLPITAAVELVVGDRVVVGADGKADKAAVDGTPIGIVYVGAAAGADAAIFLSL